jgi:adenylate kinase
MSGGLKMQDAVLLVGPTSAGKTPLGGLLEDSGLSGRECAHFDFGACFRLAAASETPPAPLDEADIGVIRTSMETGALLTDDQFHIAHKILKAFLHEKAGNDSSFVVLNGMPRHEGQAKGIEDLVDVKLVVELACDPETVMARIKLDSGGDRGGRADDLPALVTRKLAVYEAQTRPLLRYYEKKGVQVLTVNVTVVSTSFEMKSIMEQCFAATA